MIMKSYNEQCPGCGSQKQQEDSTANGYFLNPHDQLCVNCFRLKNYGIKSHFVIDINIEATLKNIKKDQDQVILIIDILNPYQTLLSSINEYIDEENLIIVVNKIDLLPKSISYPKIINWIRKIAIRKNIKFKKLILVSNYKKFNIDQLVNLIKNGNKNTSVIGYSNVGKSSFIVALFNAIGISTANLSANTIGTTLAAIKTPFNDKFIIDHPGFYLDGNFQNILDKKLLNKAMGKKELKQKVFQFTPNIDQVISIHNLFFLNFLQNKKPQNYQLLFSNQLEIKKINKFKKNLSDNFVSHELILLPNIEKQDLIISGLGFITLKNNHQKIIIDLPKDIKFNLVESIYSS
ncbi:MAG: GTPase RsgA [Mycoplasmataceae bacterium]|nr:GTPase RsgA [Mycoplasmataceae bacterium]